jgi:cytochrome o ubiquinol oxidase subunit 2
MLTKIRHLFLSMSFFLLSGCHPAMLDPKGIIAADEMKLMLTAIGLMSLVVVPVIFLTFLFAWRYRESNTKAAYLPNWTHNTVLEIIWWSIPCIIILILGAMTWTSTHKLDPYKPIFGTSKPLVIQAISLEWRWLFIYPEQHIATINFLQIPENVPVEFYITAEGPMNSFQIPQLGGQIYAMAGMQTKLNLIGNSIGDYRGFAANFSGDGFSEMKFITRVSTMDEFNAWVKKVKTSPEKLTINAYMHLALSNNNIFEVAMMRDMTPMSNKSAVMTVSHIHSTSK